MKHLPSAADLDAVEAEREIAEKTSRSPEVNDYMAERLMADEARGHLVLKFKRELKTPARLDWNDVASYMGYFAYGQVKAEKQLTAALRKELHDTSASLVEMRKLCNQAIAQRDAEQPHVDALIQAAMLLAVGCVYLDPHTTAPDHLAAAYCSRCNLRASCFQQLIHAETCPVGPILAHAKTLLDLIHERTSAKSTEANTEHEAAPAEGQGREEKNKAVLTWEMTPEEINEFRTAWEKSAANRMLDPMFKLDAFCNPLVTGHNERHIELDPVEHPTPTELA